MRESAMSPLGLIRNAELKRDDVNIRQKRKKKTEKGKLTGELLSPSDHHRKGSGRMREK
jgi:hypothetical protein